jgi:acetyl-CoA acetyltransferase
MPASGFAAMRMAQIVSGISDSVSLQWVQCSSGLQSVAHTANAIATKQIQIGIGGGVESIPAVLPNVRTRTQSCRPRFVFVFVPHLNIVLFIYFSIYT